MYNIDKEKYICVHKFVILGLTSDKTVIEIDIKIEFFFSCTRRVWKEYYIMR